MTLLLEDAEGILLWPRERVAMLREERCGRLEATSCAGEVAHRPGPLEPGPPLVPLEAGVLVHPRHVRRVEGELHVPGGWRLPAAGDLPAPEPLPPEARHFGVLPSEVLYVRAQTGGAALVLPGEERPAPRSLAGRAVAETLGGMLYAGKRLYLNARRMRRVAKPRGGRVWRVTFDEGTTLDITEVAAERLQESLGLRDLARLDHTDPRQELLRREGLRDWPRDLATAPGAFLRSAFGADERRALANLVAQLPGRGGFDGTHRGLYYNLALPMLRRGGWMAPAAAGLHLEEEDEDLLHWLLAREEGWRLAGRNDPHWSQMCQVLTALVAGGVFTYTELDFEDNRPDLREVGDRLPHVVLLVEKRTMARDARVLQGSFGTSLLIAGGLPALVGVEFLARTLDPGTPLVVLALVDWDPWGAIIRRSFVRMLERYGHRVARVVDLVRPEHFSAEELRDLSYPLVAGRSLPQGTLDGWMAEGGGIAGEARGMHSDHLRPVERLRAVVGRVLAGRLRTS